MAVGARDSDAREGGSRAGAERSGAPPTAEGGEA